MKNRLLIIGLFSLIMSGCDDSSKSTPPTTTPSTPESASPQATTPPAQHEEVIPPTQAQWRVRNNNLILTRTVESYSKNPIKSEVIKKSDGQSISVRDYLYDEQGQIISVKYTLSDTTGKVVNESTIKRVDNEWIESIIDFTNDTYLGLNMSLDDTMQLNKMTITTSKIPVPPDYFKTPFIYDEQNRVTDISYISNGIEFHSHYRYDEHNLIVEEQLTIPSIEMHANAYYTYNDKEQLSGFKITPVLAMGEELDPDTIDSNFTNAIYNEQGDWTALSEPSGETITRELSYYEPVTVTK